MLEAIVNDLQLVVAMMTTMTDVDHRLLVAGALEHTESALQADDLPWMTIMAETTDDAPRQGSMDHHPGDTMWIRMTLVDLHLQLVAIRNHTLATEIHMLVLAALLAMGMPVDMELMMIDDTRNLGLIHSPIFGLLHILGMDLGNLPKDTPLSGGNL